MPWIAAVVSALAIALIWLGVALARRRADARHEPSPAQPITAPVSTTWFPPEARAPRPGPSQTPRLATMQLYSGSVTATLQPVVIGVRPTNHGRPRIYFQPR